MAINIFNRASVYAPKVLTEDVSVITGRFELREALTPYELKDLSENFSVHLDIRGFEFSGHKHVAVKSIDTAIVGSFEQVGDGDTLFYSGTEVCSVDSVTLHELKLQGKLRMFDIERKIRYAQTVMAVKA